MPHETSLISTIAVGLALAFIGGLIANHLRLPPLVGYLLAGLAVGPFTPGFVADAGIAAQLAEIGVILLMFGVGLKFSFSDLLAVRNIAVPGALIRILITTLLGIGLTSLWGWSLGAGIVFGLALSVASTVVLLKTLEDHDAIDSGDSRIAVGWVIVEDLVMILVLVLLPALSGPLGGNPPPGTADDNLLLTVGVTLGEIALFAVLMLVVGTRVIPWLLVRVERTGSRELFTLGVLAIALGVAFGSTVLFNVSLALGAFFAGVIVNSSELSHRAAEQALPLQDAFAVLFFVSVGMLFDPAILIEEPLRVLATLAVIVVGKLVTAALIIKGLGHSDSTALKVSASLAQIGEFSFILAGLGVSLGLLPEEGQNLILAGALLSIVLNPLLFRALEPFIVRVRSAASPAQR